MNFSINRVTLAGHCGKDPELSYIPNGTALLKFSIATNRSVKKGEGWENITDWHNCVAWGKVAEVNEPKLKKGSLIMIEGRLQTRSWEDKEGKKRYATEVIVDEIVADGKGAKGSRSQSASQSNTRQPGDEFDPSTIDDSDIPF